MKTHEENCKPEFTTDDDPSFKEFSRFVQRLAVEYLDREIKTYKLKGLWFKSTKFSLHWNSSLRKVIPWMAWIGFHFALTVEEVICVVIGWMNSRGRYPNEHEVGVEVIDVVEMVWTKVQGSLAKQRDRKNRRKRLNRQKMRKHQPRKKGRPKQTEANCLRNRIINVLRAGPSAASAIASALLMNSNTVASQLRRMLIDGVVRKPNGKRGLYELLPTVHARKHSQQRRPAISVDEIDDSEVDNFGWPISSPPRDLPTKGAPELRTLESD